MELIEFAKIYSNLEEKALDIMIVYGLGHYDLEGIGVEDNNNKLLFNIKCSYFYSGCGTETEWLSFDLEEMNNDIDYFKIKYKKQVEKIKREKILAAEKEAEIRKLQKECKDKLEYKRLKLKFENE